LVFFVGSPAFFSPLDLPLGGMEPVVSVPVVAIVALMPDVPEVSVAVVLVLDGIGAVPVAVMPVPVVSVELVPVVPVLLDATPVSVTAVSVFAFSSFLQAVRRVTRDKRTRNFLIGALLLQGGECERRPLTRRYSLGANLPMSSVPSHIQQEPVTRFVESFDGTRIAYDLYDTGCGPLVMVVPGFWRERRHPSMLALARLLNANGYRAAVADPRGHGESEGTYGFNLHEHHDVSAVACDILGRLPVHSISLAGFSYGGSIAVSTAARHRLPINALLLISPVADFAMISPRINPFTIHRHIAFSQALRRPRFEFFARRSPKIRALDDIRNVHAPSCFVHVRNDWLIGHRHSVALYEAANEPKELHVMDIPGNYHADRIFSVAAESIEPLFLGFLQRHVPADHD
jgi:pimeloyl-ACP methyl ester carboxylesterase